MKDVEFWRWWMTDQWGRRRKSTCVFRESDALAQDPSATRVEGSCEIRSCAETADEVCALAPTNQHLTGWDGRRGRA